jgi:hypothetical protein
MKISEMIAVLDGIMLRTGDVKMDGVCWECQTTGLQITVLEDGCNDYVAISLGVEEDE